MSTVFSGSAPVLDTADALIDLQWEMQGEQQGASEANMNANPVSRGTRTPLPAQVSSGALGVLTGGVVTVPRDATTGIRVVNITSGAGTRTTRLGNANLTINSGAQFGLGNIPAYRRMRRYRSGALIRVPLRGTAILEMGLVFSNGFLTFLGTSPAFVLSSDPGVNGGAWTPRVRLVDAGAITTLSSIGVSPNTASFDLIEVQYTEGPVPLLELMINGTTRAVISGAPGVGVPSATGTNGGVFGFGCSAIVGTTLEYASYRYRVEEV